jgi:hypothetical protein
MTRGKKRQDHSILSKKQHTPWPQEATEISRDSGTKRCGGWEQCPPWSQVSVLQSQNKVLVASYVINGQTEKKGWLRKATNCCRRMMK